MTNGKKLYLVKKEVYAKSIGDAIKNEAKGNIYEVLETKDGEEDSNKIVGFTQTND
jgi:hypothetical protein